jgi:hypothetical protein
MDGTIILNEVSQVQKAKGHIHIFSRMWNVAQYKWKQYYEKQVMLRRAPIQDREGKRS